MRGQLRTLDDARQWSNPEDELFLVLGMGGGLVATLIADRLERFIPVAAGPIIGCVAIGPMLASRTGMAGYSIAIILFFACNLIQTFISAQFMAINRSGEILLKGEQERPE